MNKYIFNPKTKDSGIITCIPQTGKCPNNCSDCFFQSGRSYLEPLEENLPQVPSLELVKGRVVRMNDGNDSNVEFDNVIKTAQQFDDVFFNTAIHERLDYFPGPVVLTLNPGNMTDNSFHKLSYIPNNIMFLRIRTNMWNIDKVVKLAIEFYKQIPIVLTFMAYYTNSISDEFKEYYEWKQRTINSYWCLKQEKINEIMNIFKDNPYIYSCGVKGQHACKFCGNCLREYYATKERMAKIKELDNV